MMTFVGVEKAVSTGRAVMVSSRAAPMRCPHHLQFAVSTGEDVMTHDLTRRDVMKGAAGAAALAAAAVPLQPGLAQGATVTGVVFEDRSGSGRRQPGDPGIAGVLVSNGREVAKTDASGRYTLPIDDETVVFVIKPTGYMVPVEPGTMLPRFYYIHQPKGTPADLNLRYRGIDPTGPLPASVDFALRKAEEPATFEVLLFTDPQPESPVEVEFVRDDVVSARIGTDAAFGMTTGDLMFDDLSLYQRQNRIIGQIGLPWWNIPGNHDLNFEAPGARYSRETFKRVFGPTSYAFEYGGALFLMLDNVEYLGTDPTRPRRDGKYEGRIGERQRAFIANLLAEQPADRLVVAAMHIPLRTYVRPDDWAVNTSDRDEFLKLIGERPCLSISGHTHTTEHHYFGAADGFAGATPHHHHVMTAVCGSWWSGPFDHRGIATADSSDGSPNGFHVLSIDGNKYTTRFVPAKERRQMRISLDSEFHRDRRELYRDVRMGALLGSPIPRESVFATDLVVNFFDGGPRTKLVYRIGERDPVTMTHDRRPDPFVEEVFARNEATKKPWVKANPSSHIWVARLPPDLEPGTHRVEVTASDEYGRGYRDHLILEVTGEAATNVRGNRS
jgi:C terminal of Calcineurin-like phosphoesterase/N terminal of Calcineurin-like phosphoesterase/Calcineurin-like phosphoesterase/TAT (twin-arginine translocation) pathway signal sequence